MYTPEEYDKVLSKLRLFFSTGRDYIEVDGQKDLSILSDFQSIEKYVLKNKK